MPYIKEICIAGSVITIRRYHTLRYNCRGERRESREKVTTAKQETINRRLAERKLAAKMNTNFTDETGMFSDVIPLLFIVYILRISDELRLVLITTASISAESTLLANLSIFA